MSIFRRLIGSVKVEQIDNVVYVKGFNTRGLINAFFRVWGTSKIGNHIFTRLDNSSFSFNAFFVPDMYYVLTTISDYKFHDVNARMIKKLIELLKTETWFESAFRPTVSFLNRGNLSNLVYTPLKHQAEFLDLYEQNTQKFQLNGFLLAAAPGAGKTATGIFLGELLESDVNIFIVPKNSIDLVWKDSFKTLYKTHTPFWVSSDSIEPTPGCRNYAFHYESLADAISFIKASRFKNPMIWLDESHNLNELVSQRTSLFLDLVKISKTTNTIWASGTPIKAMGKEVVPLLRTIDPMFDKDAEERFIGIFGKSASRALDILNNRIGMVMHRVEKSEFNKIEPITQSVNIKIPNGNKYTLEEVRKVIRLFVAEKRDHYSTNMTSFIKTFERCLEIHEKTLKTNEERKRFSIYLGYIATIRKGYDPFRHKVEVVYCNQYELRNIVPSLPSELKAAFKDAKTVVKYVELKILGMALGQVVGRMREQCVVDMVPHSNLPDLIDGSEKKTIIFSTFVSAIKEAERILDKEGYKPTLVYGDTNKNLTAIVSKFAKDEDVNPLLATFASLSSAVPLVMANTCILLNVPFRDHIYTQAISRVDRIGQDTQVYLFNMFLDTGDEPNLSTRAGDILNWARDQVEQIIGKKIQPEVDETIALECFSETDLIAPTIMDTPIFMRW